MPKSIRSPDQQGVVPAKQTDTERVADDKLNCFQSKIDGICTPEGTAACWTPLVLFYTVFYTSSKRDRDRCHRDGESARIWQMLHMHTKKDSLFCMKDL